MANRWFNQFNWSLEKNPVILFANVTQGDVSTVVTTADTAGSLAGTFFRIKGWVTGNTYMFWFKVSGSGSNPATAADTAIEVDISTGATNTAVAAAIIAAASANTQFVTDFTVGTISGHTATFTALGGGCANAHDGLSAFATHFTFTNTGTVPILNASKSLGIKSFARTGAGLYTMVLGTPAPTSVIDLYNRLFFVGYSVISPSAVPAAPLAYVVTETVSSTGAINFKLTAADGSTATDPACGEVLMFEIYVKNSTGQ